MFLAIVAIILGLIMALTHNTTGDLVVGVMAATAGATYLSIELSFGVQRR